MKNAINTPLSPESADILQQAEHQARSFNHQYVGTEHVLLALAHSDYDAAHVLQSLGITADRIRAEIASLVTPGPQRVTLETIPLTPRANAAIQYAFDHAQSLAQSIVEPGHLLIGLLHEPGGVAGRVLRSFRLDLAALQQRVLHIRLSQMKIVEQVVRPLRASVPRKRKLREELLAHLSAIYEEEKSTHRDPAAALKAAAERFGNPDTLAGEFSRDVPLYERIGFYLERWLGWRAPESAAQYTFRIAIQMAVFTAANCCFLAAVIARKAGWTAGTLHSVAPIAGFLFLLPLDTFLLGLLYYKTRDTLWGAFGVRKSKPRAALLQCAFAGVILTTYLAMIATTRSFHAIDLQQWSFGLFGALVSIPLCLHIARTSGPTEIRDTIWACLDLNVAN